MYIPKEFKLFNQTIKVVYSRTLMDKKGFFAEWEYNKNRIILQQSTRKHPLTKEQIESSFIHEATHAFLDMAGYHKLSEDEKLVSTISNLIHQFLLQVH